MIIIIKAIKTSIFYILCLTASITLLEQRLSAQVEEQKEKNVHSSLGKEAVITKIKRLRLNSYQEFGREIIEVDTFQSAVRDCRHRSNDLAKCEKILKKFIHSVKKERTQLENEINENRRTSAIVSAIANRKPDIYISY